MKAPYSGFILVTNHQLYISVVPEMGRKLEANDFDWNTLAITLPD